MRWDYGSVYKEIRRNKHLTQEEICGNYINRSTLTRFENNQTTPSYELMRFLLKQVDMTFEEFEYLCNYYQPSERQQLLYDIDNLKTPSTQQLEELIQRCKNHLKKEPDDVPIKRRCLILETIVFARKNTNIETATDNPAQLLWSQVINNDNWYYNDIIIVGSILHILPFSTFENISEVLFERLQKYHDFKRIKPTILSHYQFLSYFFLEWKRIDKAIGFIHKLITLAKQEKRYDQLARGYVYLGIAEKKQELIDKGLKILELTEEQHILDSLKSFIKEVQTD
ncbi:TPA: helix-turn-helix transcriptional regulator [Streptococcus suis]|nr:helix-turn-helix transcriptional regulator [Streptococcus suis]